MKFREWDLDAGMVTEYRRIGECKACGECCSHLIRVAVAGESADPADGKTAMGLKGIWSEWARDDGTSLLWRVIEVSPDKPKPCWALGADGLCSAHGGIRPNLCQAWPMSPRGLENFPDCGYSFEEVGSRRIADGWPRIWGMILKERERISEIT